MSQGERMSKKNDKVVEMFNDALMFIDSIVCDLKPMRIFVKELPVTDDDRKLLDDAINRLELFLTRLKERRDERILRRL